MPRKTRLRRAFEERAMLEAASLAVAAAMGWRFTGASMVDSENPRAKEIVAMAAVVLRSAGVLT